MKCNENNFAKKKKKHMELLFCRYCFVLAYCTMHKHSHSSANYGLMKKCYDFVYENLLVFFIHSWKNEAGKFTVQAGTGPCH